MNFPEKMLEEIENEVSKGLYADRSEFVRAAVLAYLRQGASI
jgi:Arc/MetJ-type ribon-helix-helix transcriptional regulator